MTVHDGVWEALVLEADPPVPMRTIHSLAAADLDGDGHVELFFGGHSGLLWYRPDTRERGVIAAGNEYTVGFALEDVDGDGRLEIVTSEGHYAAHDWWITWYKPGPTLRDPWQRFVIDPACHGLAHDLIFADLDGDGRREMVANAVFCPVNGAFAYRPGLDLREPWQRQTLGAGIHAEGLAAADLDGDGRLEVINGPDYYSQPAAGPFAGEWQRTTYAPDMREMGRVLVCDIAGHGHPDIVLAESEYRDGKLSWFENRLGDPSDTSWVEHEIEGGLVFAHSLDPWPARHQGEFGFFLAEMEEGGWHQPYNYDARLLRYATSDHGRTWQRELLSQGLGAHQALVVDVDQDGEPEIAAKAFSYPWAHIWKKRPQPSLPVTLSHRFLDRDRPYAALEILAADVDGDGLQDAVTGAWWYRNPGWERYDIPGIHQVIAAHDLDGDGRLELVAAKRSSQPRGAAPERPANDAGTWREGLGSELCWLKPVDPLRGRWEEHPIGVGRGDWPAGALVAPLLPGGRLALAVSYHSAGQGRDDYPEIFEIPSDPRQYPWPARTLAEIRYAGNLVPCDVDGSGRLDVVAGGWWLENRGDGTFRAHRIACEGLEVARAAVADVNGDGRPDIIIGEPVKDQSQVVRPYQRLLWLENPGGDPHGPWQAHAIDRVRDAHSLAAVDLDGDGQVEIVCGEHDTFGPYRTRCRLFAYKKGDARGLTWVQHTLDGRFEHYRGATLIELGGGRLGILSHGREESKYVHLYEVRSV